MTETGAPLLEARDVTKSFAGTKALAGADLTLAVGGVHGLLRANGAGQSTPPAVSRGQVRRAAGPVLYAGVPLDRNAPREALNSGIAMVMQETSLARDL